MPSPIPLFPSRASYVFVLPNNTFCALVAFLEFLIALLFFVFFSLAPLLLLPLLLHSSFYHRSAVLIRLDAAQTYAEPTNVETNKKLWNSYAREWAPEAEHIVKMRAQLPPDHAVTCLGDEWCPTPPPFPILPAFVLFRCPPLIQLDTSLLSAPASCSFSASPTFRSLQGVYPNTPSDDVSAITDIVRRSDKASLDAVFRDFFDAQLTDTALCAEIGVGGGRIASRVLPKVKRLDCFDISSEMLKVAEKNLKVLTFLRRLN